MKDDVDIVPPDDIEDLVRPGAIEVFKHSFSRGALRNAEIGCDHPVGAVTPAQSRNELGPDLAERSCHQRLCHGISPRLITAPIAPTKACSVTRDWISSTILLREATGAPWRPERRGWSHCSREV